VVDHNPCVSQSLSLEKGREDEGLCLKDNTRWQVHQITGKWILRGRRETGKGWCLHHMSTLHWVNVVLGASMATSCEVGLVIFFVQLGNRHRKWMCDLSRVTPASKYRTEVYEKWGGVEFLLSTWHHNLLLGQIRWRHDHVLLTTFLTTQSTLVCSVDLCLFCWKCDKLFEGEYSKSRCDNCVLSSLMTCMQIQQPGHMLCFPGSYLLARVLFFSIAAPTLSKVKTGPCKHKARVSHLRSIKVTLLPSLRSSHLEPLHFLNHNLPSVYMEIFQIQTDLQHRFPTARWTSTQIWTQGSALAKQVLYCLSHTSNPFCSGYFEVGVSQTIYLGWL
jgi:hypothetical protein